MVETKNDGWYKWRMLFFLAFSYFLMHAARQIFNTALPDIKLTFASQGISDGQWGLSRTVFLFAYGLMVPLAGIAADLSRRKWVIVVGALLFSASVFVTGFATGFLPFLLLYGLFNGWGQCMLPASSSSLIAQHHTETRSTALSFYQIGLYFGIIIASLCCDFAHNVSTEGWRYVFICFGGLGLLWLLVLIFFLRDTPQPVHADGSVEKASFREAALAMVSKPSALLLTFAFGMLVYGSNCFRTWMPMFMRENPAFESNYMSLHAVLWFYIGSFIGIFSGARISDRLSKKHPGVRLEIMALGMLLSAPAMAAMVYMPTLPLCCLMMFIFGVGGGFFDCNLYAGLFDVVAPRYRAAATGVYLAGAFILGCPATAVVGWMKDHTSLQTAIAIFGSTYLIGGIAIAVARAVFYKKDRVDE